MNVAVVCTTTILSAFWMYKKDDLHFWVVPVIVGLFPFFLFNNNRSLAFYLIWLLMRLLQHIKWQLILFFCHFVRTAYGLTASLTACQSAYRSSLMGIYLGKRHHLPKIDTTFVSTISEEYIFPSSWYKFYVITEPSEITVAILWLSSASWWKKRNKRRFRLKNLL